MLKFDIVLLEKPEEEGLTITDIQDLYALLNDTEAYPIEIENFNGGSIAMGFIIPAAADRLDFKYDGLKEFIGRILADMTLEKLNHQYEFEGLSVFLTR